MAAFLGLYELGNLLSFAGIAEGVENSNYLLRTDKANYILTLYEKRVHADDLPFFIGLMQHLSQTGLNCPVPVADKNGQILQELCGRPAAIVTFLDGTSQRYPNVDKCRALGQALAQFHRRSEGFEGVRENALGPKGWAPLLASIDGELPGIPDGTLELTTASLNEILDNWPANLPAGHIHADMFPNNVLFVGDKLTGIIDFYFACQDLYAYDIAVCLNSWCFDADGSFNITKSGALLHGYEKERPLLEAEKQALPILNQGAAMRFFLTRLYDWINTPADALVAALNPMEFWSRLRFHQRAKGPEDYGLWS